MELLLAAAGVGLAFAIGWAVGRSRRADAVVPESVAEPAAVPSFADVVEEHRAGVVVADGRGVITFRNAAARAIKGTHVGVLVDEAIERHLRRSTGSGDGDEEVLELYGPPRTVLVVDARPLPDGGTVVFVEDISEQRRAEQVRTDFVANISHELKTPVGALAVLAETLQDETDPDTVDRIVARMMGEAERAARTIDDLMELSRIELGAERELETTPVASIVEEALGRVTELAAQREIGISVLDPVDADGERTESPVVTGDRRQLVSALGNLVENAVKYSEPGSSVQLRSRRLGGQIEIMVADHGVGIPQRDLDRIFERFHRVDRARSRATGGTGLGLSIVRHVATNHGGEVLVSSTEGQGSTFVLRLPLGDRGDAAIVERDRRQDEGVV